VIATDTGASSSTAPAVRRAAAILDVVAANGKPIGPSELSRRLHVAKSSIINICNELVAANMLRKTENGYTLGRHLAELGEKYLSGLEAVREFYSVCHDLLGEAVQTAQLAVLGDGLATVYLARCDGREPLRLGLSAEIGRSVPATCTAAGKALLAAIPAADLDERLERSGELPALTARSITSVATLRSELAVIRERRYAIDDEETFAGLRCFGASVRTAQRLDGLLAVSFSYRKSYATAERSVAIAGELATFANEFQQRLGGGTRTLMEKSR
jgi:DNA-binding IclR family transcriptional regulator